MTITVGSLFTGIGGLDLGLERAGMTVTWQAENDPYCCRILNRHWPHVPNLGDVTTIEWSSVPRVDLICGGYPCQPFSTAGARRGARDPRHLWPHMRDAIRVLRPRWALLENVPGHLSLGFGRVLGDLAEIGFDAEWDCIPAVAVGAPHLRWRVFVVAYPQRQSDHIQRTPLLRGWEDDTEQAGVGGSYVSDPERHQLRQQPGRRDGQDRSDTTVARDDGPDRHVADTDRSTGGSTTRDAINGNGRTPLLGRRAPQPRGRHSDVADVSLTERRTAQPQGLATTGWRTPEPRECFSRPPSRNDWWTTEPDVGRVAHGIPHRVDRLRALGNAVVPQVAEHIGRLIVEAAA